MTIRRKHGTGRIDRSLVILAKLIGLVRSEGIVGTLRHLRLALWHRAHKAWDRRFRADGLHDRTTTKVELDELTIDSLNRAAGVHYLPTPWSVLDWLHAALPNTKAKWAFVDLGSGKGRALISAGRLPYAQVVGIEFAAELVAIARDNLSAAQGLRAGSVDLVLGDATSCELPRMPVVVYLFNPFGPPVIERVAAAIRRSYRETPRPIIIAYLNPQHQEVFEALNDFSELRLSWPLAAKFQFLSPYPLKLFATPEARTI